MTLCKCWKLFFAQSRTYSTRVASRIYVQEYVARRDNILRGVIHQTCKSNCQTDARIPPFHHIGHCAHVGGESMDWGAVRGREHSRLRGSGEDNISRAKSSGKNESTVKPENATKSHFDR